VGDVDTGEGCACGGGREIWEVSVPSDHFFFCDLKPLFKIDNFLNGGLMSHNKTYGKATVIKPMWYDVINKEKKTEYSSRQLLITE
jgi:hypothetical protein